MKSLGVMEEEEEGEVLKGVEVEVEGGLMSG